jgi:triacylglycerol esterase/lipase EstA (alpha/beta hydrolase family)
VLSRLDRLAPARRTFVLVVAAVLAALAVVAGVVALTALRGRLVTPVDQGTAGPVLLVPGYGGSAASLQSLATRLRESGRDVTVVDLPDRAQGDLSAQSDALGTTANDVLARTGARSVDVVGYSAGGVVARLWATEGDGPGKVRRLVMLGSPLHGTDVARLGTLVSGTCPTACQQLAPDSPVLSRLDNEPLPGGVLGLSLWTAGDEVVQPPTSSVEDGVPSPSIQSVCAASRVNHGGLPNDRAVQAMVLEALGTGAIPTWQPGDCGRLSS